MFTRRIASVLPFIASTKSISSECDKNPYSSTIQPFESLSNFLCSLDAFKTDTFQYFSAMFQKEQGYQYGECLKHFWCCPHKLIAR